jgi:hypothetical protein
VCLSRKVIEPLIAVLLLWRKCSCALAGKLLASGCACGAQTEPYRRLPMHQITRDCCHNSSKIRRNAHAIHAASCTCKHRESEKAATGIPYKIVFHHVV